MSVDYYMKTYGPRAWDNSGKKSSGKQRNSVKRKVRLNNTERMLANKIAYAIEQKSPKKYIDIDLDTNPLVTTGTVTNLAIIPQGDGAEKRTSSRILIKKLQINFFVETLTNTTNAGNISRIMLVQDNGVNKAAIGLSGILQDAGANDNLHSFRNLGYTNRIKMLKETTLSLNCGTVVTATDNFPTTRGPMKNWIVTPKGNPITVYDDAIATTGAINTQSGTTFYFVHCADNANAQLRGTARIYYKDL